MEHFITEEYTADVCVIGGGLSGLCAAVAAARNGAKTVLMHDRPMLGGNASSEIRMWVCGANGKNNRETGIVEELMLENYYRNPYKNYSIWDSVMLELAWKEPNLQLLLNCSCLDGEMNGNRLKSVKGWQLTTQKYHKVSAEIFIDCSGDSVLAPITGAKYRTGREARNEFGESIAPENADKKTMGLSCMLQVRECAEKSDFIPPSFAEKLTKDNFRFSNPNLADDMENFWYLELGGTQNTIDDAESIRDRLIKIAYGTFDYLKNSPNQAQKNGNYRLEWVGAIPGKRESRRYVGDYILTQNDISSQTKFSDEIAYGGWTMDDHNPDGFDGIEPPNIHHPAPSPYGIPYRCIYSKNIDNLMFAGRNISVTHTAMSSTRVMATCGLLGQAAGTAAAIAVSKGITPREVGEFTDELQERLMRDDVWLPDIEKETGDLTENAELYSDMENAELLRNGMERQTGDNPNYAVGKGECYAEYNFGKTVGIKTVRLVFDSDLNRETLPERERKMNRAMVHNIHLDFPKSYLPKTLIKKFRIIFKTPHGEECVTVDNYHQRLFLLNKEIEAFAVRVILDETHGLKEKHLFSFEVN